MTMNDQQPLTSTEVDHVLAQIVQRAQELIPFDGGGILVFDTEAKMLAPHTYRQSTPDAPIPHLVRPGEGLLGYVAQSRQAVLVNDVTRDPRYVADDSQTRAMLAVPIISNGELVGVFNAESTVAGIYSDQHLKILSALADHAALTLNMARQVRAQSQRYERLTEFN